MESVLFAGIGTGVYRGHDSSEGTRKMGGEEQCISDISGLFSPSTIPSHDPLYTKNLAIKDKV